MGFASGRAGAAQIIDGSERPAANILADAVSSLEDTSVITEIQIR